MILRAHHLLCVLGFRGRGYSRQYVENMSNIVARLRSSPEVMVEISHQPDDICPPCPFLGEGGCRQEGPESKEKIRSRDCAVMEKLGLVVGMKLPWSNILKRIKTSVRREDLAKICQDCEWLLKEARKPCLGSSSLLHVLQLRQTA